VGKTYWMLCTTQENFDITKSHGFDIQGIDTRNRRKAVRMSPEDRIVYYITDAHGFATTATVTSEHFEDHERIWKHHRPQEDFPHRVNVQPDAVLDTGHFVDGFQVGPTLEYVKKWAPEHWELAFFGMLHIIPQRDFNYLELEIQRAATRAEAERATGKSGAKKAKSKSAAGAPAD
jgi:predicted RNA-binding protein